MKMGISLLQQYQLLYTNDSIPQINNYAVLLIEIQVNIPVRQHRKSGRRETVCPGLRKPLMRVYSRNVLSKP